MFQLYYDTDLESLADRLAGLLARPDAELLLTPQTVLVPQAGLEQWLVQRLAQRHGIAANLEFLAPAQMVWRLLRAWQPDLPYHSPFDREALRWRLLALLAAPPEDDPAVARMVEAENDPLRRFQLATHLAQLFERYQAYRRDLLDAWTDGAEPDEPQAGLWRALTRPSDTRSRSRLLGDYLHAFAREDAAPPPGLPSRLCVFGCINVSPDVLRCIGLVGRYTDLHFFLPSPCKPYWGDIPHRRDKLAQLREEGGSVFDEPDNPLLVSMGGLGRDFMAQVFGYDEIQPDVEPAPADAEPPRRTLLQRVQADVLTQHRATADEREPAPDPADVSLTWHVCHSPLREVQVLHDRLLDLFQTMPDLEPRDVAVLVPQMERYAPCVDAVFGALTNTDKRRIPWTIADRPAAQTHALTALFLRLLDVPASRLELDMVLDVLDVPAVARACGLADTNLDDLRGMAVAAGICRDEDAADRVAHDLPAFAEYSWAFGRERLVLGYALGTDAVDDDALAFDRAPVTDVEGQRAVALGQLLHVERVLADWRRQAREPVAPSVWQQRLNALLDALVPTPEGHDEERALDIIRAALRDLAEGAETAGFNAAIDWRCVRDYLRTAMQGAAAHQYLLAGGVNVCGMVPLRSVPFRVICVLGLDAQSFPRQAPVDAMSRLQSGAGCAGWRLGDRSTRADDRYLFLQTLMAARDVLYLSWTGRNAGDGSPIEPSVLVSELLETVCGDYFSKPAEARGMLVTTHTLQPFSRRLFATGDTRLYTYRHEWREAAGTVGGSAEPAPFVDVDWPAEAAVAAYDLDDFKAFFSAPQKFFLRRRVGLSMDEVEDQAPNHEPLVDQPLARAARERQLVARLRDAPPGDSLAWARAHALLPPLALGAAAHADSLDLLVPQARRWRTRAPADPAARICRLPLPSGRIIEGALAYRDGAGIAGWIGSGHQGKNWMRWWLEALVARASGAAVDGLVLGRGGKEQPLPWVPVLPDSDTARQWLDQLLDVYTQGQRRPLRLPPRTGWAFASNLHKKEGMAMSQAMKMWEGESVDPWVGVALRGWQPDRDQGFSELARSVYEPLCTAIRAGAHA